MGWGNLERTSVHLVHGALSQTLQAVQVQNSSGKCFLDPGNPAYERWLELIFTYILKTKCESRCHLYNGNNDTSSHFAVLWYTAIQMIQVCRVMRTEKVSVRVVECVVQRANIQSGKQKWWISMIRDETKISRKFSLVACLTKPCSLPHLLAYCKVWRVVVWLSPCSSH